MVIVHENSSNNNDIPSKRKFKDFHNFLSFKLWVVDVYKRQVCDYYLKSSHGLSPSLHGNAQVYLW